MGCFKYPLELFEIDTKKIKLIIIGLLLAVIAFNIYALHVYVPRPANIFDYLKIAWIIPLLASISALIGYFSIKDNDFKLRKRILECRYKVIFQITTRGFNVDALKRSVGSVKYWAPKYLQNYEIWIVTEPDADSEIDNIKGVKIIKVPYDFSTPNETKYKARALEYAKELRKDYDHENTWIYFMDEESIVGEDTILGIIDFIENKKGLIGQGLIIYSNFFGKNIFTSLADSVRSSADVSTYAFQIKIGFVSWMHGSHILIRSDVEQQIGWDFGKTWGEDSLFGLKAQELGYRIEWLKGRLYEQSPFTIKDFLKQRRRWALHSFDILKRKLPLKVKLTYFYSLLIWASGLISLIAAISAIFSRTLFPFNNAIILAVMPVMVTWIGSYLVGLYLNTQPLDISMYYKILFAIISVIIGSILDGIAIWYAIFTIPLNKNIAFEVIKK
jgi:cellulose synthase/poly-beta-1,6-N-acetylglucosamine synthase-like glycosyltransferase